MSINALNVLSISVASQYNRLCGFSAADVDPAGCGTIGWTSSHSARFLNGALSIFFRWRRRRRRVVSVLFQIKWSILEILDRRLNVKLGELCCQLRWNYIRELSSLSFADRLREKRSQLDVNIVERRLIFFFVAGCWSNACLWPIVTQVTITRRCNSYVTWLNYQHPSPPFPSLLRPLHHHHYNFLYFYKDFMCQKKNLHFDHSILYLYQVL